MESEYSTRHLVAIPVLFQHFFWFYSHPAVYIMILPAFGIISELIAVFSRHPIHGYRFVALSSVAIAFLGFLVWGHHMFVSGQSAISAVIFSLITYLIGIPTGVKMFNWVATMYRGSIWLQTPMLYALSFLFLFAIGGFTGIALGVLALDVHLHDTYFVVGHFHYVMMGGTVIAALGGLHYWWPKITGKMYNEMLGRIAAALIFVGFNITFFTQLVLGTQGMPRRYYDYLPRFETMHEVSTYGSWILGAGLFIVLFYLLASLFRGRTGAVKSVGRGNAGVDTCDVTARSSQLSSYSDRLPGSVRFPSAFRGVRRRTCDAGNRRHSRDSARLIRRRP